MTHSSVVYSNPCEADIYQMHNLGKKIFTWTFEKVTWDESLVAWYLTNHNSYCFVAKINGDIIGFTLSYKVYDICYMGWICVKNDFRGLGVARELQNRTIRVAYKDKDINNICAHVRDDEICVNWLMRNGFKDIGERKIEMMFNLNDEVKKYEP